MNRRQLITSLAASAVAIPLAHTKVFQDDRMLKEVGAVSDVLQEVSAENDDRQLEIDRLMDGMYFAWVVIANSMDWDDKQRAEWRTAAEKWRDEYWHPSLDRNCKRDAPKEEA